MDRDVVIIADRDEPGRKHAREVAASLRDVVRSLRMFEPPAAHKDLTDLIASGGKLWELVMLEALGLGGAVQSNGAAETGRAATVRFAGATRAPAAPELVQPEPEPVDKHPGGAMLLRLSDVQPQPIRWLWAGWLALGKIAILDGDPGLGKSLLTLDIAARVSNGGLMPCGSPGHTHRQPAGVVLLTAEDDAADTLRPRLDAAGADVSSVVALSGVRDDGGEERMPNLRDVDAIRKAIEAVGARLVVIDPVMAFLGGDAHRDNEVRQSLGPIACLAAQYGVSVLVVRHLNKSGGTHAVYRGGGSIGIIGAARTGMLVAQDPEDDAGRVLAPTKSNLAELPGSLTYRIVAPNGVARVQWGGTSHHTAGELLSAAEQPGDPSAAEEAGEWLRGELQDGPRLVADLRRGALACGLAWRTVERAKTALGIGARRQNAGGGQRGAGGWCWRRPGDSRNPAFKTANDVQDRHGGLEDCPMNPAIDVQGRQTPDSGGLEGEARASSPSASSHASPQIMEYGLP